MNELSFSDIQVFISGLCVWAKVALRHTFRWRYSNNRLLLLRVRLCRSNAPPTGRKSENANDNRNDGGDAADAAKYLILNAP